MRGHVLRYLGWQVADRTGPRIVVSWIVGGAMLALVRTAVGEQSPPPSDQRLLALIGQVHQQFTFIFAIILAHGIVSIDRTAGYFRFYLAKPVSPVWFYGQAMVLAFAGMAAVSAGFAVFASLLLRPLWPWSLVLNGLAVFALVGMLTAFYSTLSRHDWLWAIVTLIMSAVLRARFPAERSGLGRVLHAALPPNHLLGAETRPDALGWLWLGGWALGLLAAACLLLRRRPLGEG